jgi:hypothetical protein
MKQINATKYVRLMSHLFHVPHDQARERPMPLAFILNLLAVMLQ